MMTQTRGFDAEEFAEVAEIIAESLQPDLDDQRADKLRTRVAALAARFPLYPTIADVRR